MDKRLLFLLGAFLAVLLIAFLVRSAGKREGDGSSTTIVIGNHIYPIEIATTLVDQARGLSGRTSLPQGQGMLFTFATSSMQAFWMHGMEFPLDFVWIDGGKVIGVTEQVPADSQEIYNPPAPSKFVLELNAGTVQKDGIKVGDAVHV